MAFYFHIFKTALNLTTEFINLDNSTNIILTGDPHRHDLHSHSFVNNEKRKYNRSLLKITKATGHTKFLEQEGDWVFIQDMDYT